MPVYSSWRFGRGQWLRQYPVDATSLHFQHLEAPARALDHIAHARQLASFRQQQAADGVVAALVLVGQVMLDTQARFHLANRHQAVQQPAAIGLRRGPSVDIGAGVTNANYLGFRFTEGGNTYYGWISLTTTGPNGFPATLNSYCYENTPNTQITAGTTPVSLQQFSVD